MIQIDNLSKNYGDVQAVDSISFSLNDVNLSLSTEVIIVKFPIFL